jgi:hypothetical protein
VSRSRWMRIQLETAIRSSTVSARRRGQYWMAAMTWCLLMDLEGPLSVAVPTPITSVVISRTAVGSERAMDCRHHSEDEREQEVRPSCCDR